MTPNMVNVVVGGLSVSPPDHDDVGSQQEKTSGALPATLLGNCYKPSVPNKVAGGGGVEGLLNHFNVPSWQRANRNCWQTDGN